MIDNWPQHVCGLRSEEEAPCHPTQSLASLAAGMADGLKDKEAGHAGSSSLKKEVSEDGFVWVDESNAPFFTALPSLAHPAAEVQDVIGLAQVHADDANGGGRPWYMEEVLRRTSEVAEGGAQAEAIPPFSDLPEREAILAAPGHHCQPLQGEVDEVRIHFSQQHPPMTFEMLHSSESEECTQGPVNELPPDIVTDGQFVRAIQRYAQLAKGAYALDDAALAERTNLPADKLLQVDFRERCGAFPRPAFYLAVDDQLQCLVLAIRGTKTMLEVQIDTEWHAVEFPLFPSSSVHSGILKAARWFVDNLLSRLVKLSEIFPNHSIRVVGHSLGGAVAALFTLMVKDVLPTVKAVIFAPVACVSRSLVPLCDQCCVSFVNRSDMVPSCSKAKLFSLLSPWTSTSALVSMPDAEAGSDIDQPPPQPIGDHPQPESCPNLPSQGGSSVDEELFPPGVLHHMFKSQVDTFHMRRVPFDHFSRNVPIGHAMLRHHKLDSYRNAIDAMVASAFD